MQFPSQFGKALPAFALGIALFTLQAGAQSFPPPQGNGSVPAGPSAPAPPKPYKAVPFKLPQAVEDPTFELFRKQLAEVLKRKDFAALQKLVVTQGFFWESAVADQIQNRKSNFENFAAAIDLNDAEGSGWDVIAAAVAETTLERMPDRKGIMCGPAQPQFDEKTFDAVMRETGTDPEEWGFPVAKGLEVRASSQPGAAVSETLGLHLVRVMPEDFSSSGPPPELLRIVTPAGKIGYVPIASLLPILFDQLCYTKDSGGWKIAGYFGG